MDFRHHFVLSLLEFFDALAETFGELRDALGTEKNQDCAKHNDQFSPAQT
jgi:hypothetical protein